MGNNANYDLRALEHKLLPLPHTYRVAFAASCCERAYPNYVIFFQHARWGGPATLRRSLDTVWDFVGGAVLPLADVAELESKCESVTPDLDDFSTADIDVQAAAAQEAAFMVRLLLQFSRSDETSYALRIVTFARDTIDMYVQVLENLNPDDPQLDDKISQHPLMLQELQAQEDDLLKLAEIKTSTGLREFGKRSINRSYSNIGLASGGTDKLRH